MSETEGYILNTVQTPAPIETVYRSIERGNTTKEEIRDDTDLPENLFSQGLSGLQEIGLIGRQEPDYYTVDLPWDTGNDALNFRMGVLHELTADANPDDWGKQSVVLLNYQYLLQENIQTFESNDEGVYSPMNSFGREQGYKPLSEQGPIDMNEPKMVNWTRIAEFLGLVYKANGRRHTTRPDDELVYQSVVFATESEGKERITIKSYVDWLNENLLLVDITSDGELPGPLARVLFDLVGDNRIRIVEAGDAGSIGLQGVPTKRGIDSEANSIEVVV